MKVLIIGPCHFAAYESSCARYFKRQGCQVDRWDSKALFGRFNKLNWWKLGNTARIAFDLAMAIYFVKKVASIKPDILFIPKAENLHFRALRAAKKNTKAKLLVWYPDNPFRPENTSMNILRRFEDVDIFYIWGKFLIDPLKAAGCSRVEYLPFAFDPELHDLSENQINSEIACQHIGTYSLEKRDALLPLAECGLQIWGPGWEMETKDKGPLAENIKGSGLFGQEMVDAYRRAVVIANPIRLQNMPAHNLRTIEAAGIGGGVVLTQRTKEQAEELFVEDEHILCYASADEMKEKAEWAIRNRHLAKKMAELAREKVLTHHTLDKRIKKIISDAKSL
jgi:spore maturation protein CgeB